jgi:hypothetical protein
LTQASGIDGVCDSLSRFLKGQALPLHHQLCQVFLPVGVEALGKQIVDGDVEGSGLVGQTPQSAVRPLRAAVDNPMAAWGDFTMAEVMLTMRPKRRSFMPSMTPWIMKVGASRFASSAACH